MTETSPPQNELEKLLNLNEWYQFQDNAGKLFIAHKLKENAYNVAKTAREINIQRSHLYNLIHKYNIKRK